MNPLTSRHGCVLALAVASASLSSQHALADETAASAPPQTDPAAAALPPTLVRVGKEGIALTRKGFLLSNSLICHILAE